MAFRRFLLLISAAPILLAAGEFQQKQILMEDFESGANWECAGKNAAATRDNSSVIFGESSLVCRAPKILPRAHLRFQPPTSMFWRWILHTKI